MDLMDSLGMLNSSVQFAGAAVGQSKSKSFIRQENQKARDFSLEMWNKQNEYNLPVNQRARFEAAGLNPNLIYGDGTSTLASLGQTPGHSAPNMNDKDLARYANIFGAYASSQQLQMQKDLVQSQISLNESAEAKNIASAEESRSKIPGNLSNKHLLDSMTDLNKLDVAFNELTFQTRNAIVNFDAALKEQNIELIRSSIKNLDAKTANDNRLTDMRITSMAEAIKQAWTKLDLDKQQMIGQLKYWSAMGDAAQRTSKANFLNALTKSKEFDLENVKYHDFSPRQLELLDQNITKLRTFNGWYDLMLETQLQSTRINNDYTKSRDVNQRMHNDSFDMELFMPLLEDVISPNVRISDGDVLQQKRVDHYLHRTP